MALRPPACKTLSLSIRRARRDEIQACADLYERVGSATFSWRPKNWFKATDFLRFAKEEAVYVAESNGQILGILSLYRPERFVHCLYVDMPAQGLGVGTALLAHVAKDVRGPLALKVDEPNSRALAFYKALGFIERDSGDDHGIRWLLLRQDA
ncbi:MAG: GNAT family N-acetyltransferase [Alphaproteobacteria bacterium]|nr:GNAT family N-acetyltransferase [Alphaproteobacteria bacterium]